MSPKNALTEKCSIRPSCSSGENPVTSSFFGRLSRLLLPPGGCPRPLPACCVCCSPLATHFVALPRTTVPRPRPLPSRPIAAACNQQYVSLLYTIILSMKLILMALPRTTVPRPRPQPSRPIAAACNQQDASRFGWQTLPHYIVYNNNLQHYIYIYLYIFFLFTYASFYRWLSWLTNSSQVVHDLKTH